MELAIAQLLKEGRENDPEYIRRVEEMLLRGIEARLEFESWRAGKRMYCRLYGFTRTGNRLEVRGKLTDENPAAKGIGVRDKNGLLRWWAGPQLPCPEGPFEVENLPLPSYEELSRPPQVEMTTEKEPSQ